MPEVSYLPVILSAIAAYFLLHLFYALLTILYQGYLVTYQYFILNKSGRLAMSDNGLPPALTEVLACLELISRRLRARVASHAGRAGPFPTNSLRLAPAWPAAEPVGPPPEPVARPSRTVVWRDPPQLPNQGLGQCYGRQCHTRARRCQPRAGTRSTTQCHRLGMFRGRSSRTQGRIPSHRHLSRTRLDTTASMTSYQQ